MSERKAFVIRVDPKILNAMEKWAADEMRSVNAQIEYILKKSLIQNGRMRTAAEATDGV